MDNFYMVLFSILFTTIVGIMGYFVKSIHHEVKLLIKELMDYTHELKQLIVGIQTQIDKGIETDIQEIKADIKTLYSKVNKSH